MQNLWRKRQKGAITLITQTNPVNKKVAQRWEDMAKQLGWDVDGDHLRKRFQETLLPKFRKDELTSMKATGVDEDFNQVIVLLTEIDQLLTEYEKVVKSSEKDEQAEEVKGETIRNNAVMTKFSKSFSISQSKKGPKQWQPCSPP